MKSKYDMGILFKGDKGSLDLGRNYELPVHLNDISRLSPIAVMHMETFVYVTKELNEFFSAIDVYNENVTIPFLSLFEYIEVFKK